VTSSEPFLQPIQLSRWRLCAWIVSDLKMVSETEEAHEPQFEKRNHCTEAIAEPTIVTLGLYETFGCDTLHASLRGFEV